VRSLKNKGSRGPGTRKEAKSSDNDRALKNIIVMEDTMENYDELLELIDRQENELQFTEFTSETALKIGLDMIERAKKEGKKITIDIVQNGLQLFHYSFDGMSPANDQWAIKKAKVVSRFFRSSYYINTLLNKAGQTLEEMYGINTLDYTAYGGCFPIRIKNVGVVGTIAVSGLSQEEDNEAVVSAVQRYLQK
jgi:uncharacterized protein (UPF0303 family)